MPFVYFLLYPKVILDSAYLCGDFGIMVEAGIPRNLGGNIPIYLEDSYVLLYPGEQYTKNLGKWYTNIPGGVVY